MVDCDQFCGDETTMPKNEQQPSLTCFIWEERNSNWGHASVGLTDAIGTDDYVSVWPASGVTPKTKAGKIIPAPAQLSNFILDQESESLDGATLKKPDHVFTIPLTIPEYNKLRQSAETIKKKISTNQLRYCAVNVNLPFYGESGIEACNCTGIAQSMIEQTSLVLDKKILMYPSELAEELKIATNPSLLEERKKLTKLESSYERSIHSNYF